MSRRAEPRWYESRGGWYVCIGGKQVLLAKGRAAKAEAFEEFHRLMAEGIDPGRRVDLNVEVLLELFLDSTKSKVAAATYEGYQRRLQSFLDFYGRTKAKDIRPLHIHRWLDQHPAWNDSTRFGYVAAVKRAFRWAHRQGHLESDPVANTDRPTMGRRTAVLTADQYQEIIAKADVPRLRRFRDLLIGLWETGCRPGELATLTADRVYLERGVWIVLNKTRHATGRETRAVGLTDVAIDLSRRLLAVHPEGLIFRNLRGRAWTRHAMACNFGDLRQSLGFGREVTAYAFRHRYATDAMIRGSSAEALAIQLGHSDTKMILSVYSHAAEDHDHLRQLARSLKPALPPAGEDA